MSTNRSAAAAARRAQIIEATIETVAELGYARTTFARIAARGGLSSTRLISYHFDSKTALMQAVLDDVYRSIDAFLLARRSVDPASRPIGRPADGEGLDPPASAAAELRAYITGVVAYVDDHRSRLRALQSIFAAVHDDPDSPAAHQADPQGQVMSHLHGLLRRGQEQGEFRSFDPLVIAAMVQRTLEGLTRLLDHPDVDLPHYAEELATAVDLATRRHD
ncbi:TetR/AcrR family transcriptional regulator [Microlunatus parietis]|uniref:AcrR family transcriptional regulator n=1 Tax=Microlunatus parietis TaxID=682979 RepID=A0A7Y9IBD1_9ACTN|nr:TetR/AcrR family transcriptional regulator [Microlunatus parietis]NYE73523.1 AcrR family transcriptional regulator [Microlunatus parietis]